MITKVVKARTRVYGKLTRALLRHLRGNGARVDARAHDLRAQRAQVLAKIIQIGRDPATDEKTRQQVQDLLVGSIGVNDQIDAMLS